MIRMAKAARAAHGETTRLAVVGGKLLLCDGPRPDEPVTVPTHPMVEIALRSEDVRLDAEIGAVAIGPVSGGALRRGTVGHFAIVDAEGKLRYDGIVVEDGSDAALRGREDEVDLVMERRGLRENDIVKDLRLILTWR